MARLKTPRRADSMRLMGVTMWRRCQACTTKGGRMGVQSSVAHEHAGDAGDNGQDIEGPKQPPFQGPTQAHA